MEGDIIAIKIAFGSTKLDMVFEPTKADVVATFDYINSRMDANEDDPTAEKIASFNDRLKTTNDKTEKALKGDK